MINYPTTRGIPQMYFYLITTTLYN